MVEERREMVLSHADIGAIVDEIEKRGLLHKCRYDVAPDDMREIIEFVRPFNTGAKETKTMFRKFLVRAVVYGTIGALTAGILSRVAGWHDLFHGWPK